jgi:pimeloyl-ACP methyl ester carboxylesterase
MTSTYRIRGTEIKSTAVDNLTADVKITSSRRLQPGAARDAGVGEIEAAADDVVRVELENGFVVWTRTDDLIRDRGRKSISRSGEELAWEIDTRPQLRGDHSAHRGWLKIGVRVLEFFGVDLTGKSAAFLGEKLERKLLGGEPKLYHCSLDEPFRLTPVDAAKPLIRPAAQAPSLVFLHGTASSGQGSFGKLWENSAGADARHKLQARYGQRVYSWEHRSLTESPIANALQLAKTLLEPLPDNTELDLVSHSRGGLVGEVLCLAQRERGDDPLQPHLIETLFAADRIIAEQLGLGALDSEQARERDAGYQRDREALLELCALLDRKKPRINRFVRVACPARGTTLASGRLDRWLSMLSWFAGKGFAAEAMDFLLAVVKERTDPRTLPGLEAMMPGSALTRLLQHPTLTTHSDLTVIAGDVEGNNFWSELKLLASDWFYDSDHDLVVNTGSMYGGIRRPAGRARFRRDQGPEVNHFSYFSNSESIHWLVHGLNRVEGGTDRVFSPIEDAGHEPPRWRAAVQRSRASAEARPLAVVLPGTMGSELEVRGRDVWLNYWALLRGGLKDLEIDAGGVDATDLLDDFYGPLLERLARTHRVEIHPYDWRQSIRQAAALLADRLESLLPEAERTRQPVHLVAHSMGGLVARAMIADTARGNALWRRIIALPNSRLLMLGTPNRGSYEAVRWLSGYNPTQAKLSLLDLTQGTTDIVNLVRKFPGLAELLPFDDDSPDFSQRSRWQEIKDTTNASWRTPTESVLGKARATWALLKEAPPEPKHMIYVAGHQDATVADYRFQDRQENRNRGQRLEFLAVREGDGTVTWKSGILPGVPVWYVEDTAHDAMCSQSQAFPGYLELLNTGTTTKLLSSPPARSRAQTGQPELFPMPMIPVTDDIPDEQGVRSMSFGSGRPVAALDDRAPSPVIEVEITHGNLAYAKFPVVVGHYMGDTIVNAEAALNERLGDIMAQRHELGLYPGPHDTHALFFNANPRGKPAGAVVIGMGQVGQLSPGSLESGIRRALLDYALQVSRWPDNRFGLPDEKRAANVSFLLVGSGPGGLPVGDCVEVILRAAVAANSQLIDSGIPGQALIEHLEFIDIYADVALMAAKELESVLTDRRLAEAVTWPEQVIQCGQGGLRRALIEPAPGWWQRLEIIEEEDGSGLRFVAATGLARIEVTHATGQLQLADQFIRQASQSPRHSSEDARTLFEMLLPNRLKEVAPEMNDRVLLVDEASARYPWELLEDRWGPSGEPLAVGAGLVRQLQTPQFRPHPKHATDNLALVIGNPDLEQWHRFPDLPGARKEAQTVTERLMAASYSVTDCIDASTEDIVNALHKSPWRILHLAGHGEHEFLPDADADGRSLETLHPASAARGGRKLLSGMIIGNNKLLTPGDVDQMRHVPEVVFINCCHLGKTVTKEPRRFGRLAANLGVQFINMGVKAVIAAGWAVEDNAASAFADSFYRHLLAGETFGDSAQMARRETWSRYRQVNTWGAYQCYGDPGFRLFPGESQSSSRPPPRYHAPAQLVAALENLAANSGMGVKETAGKEEDDPSRVMAGEISRLLARVPEIQRQNWQQRADVAAAVGFAWGEVNAWDQAVEWLEKAMRATDGDCPVRAVEQCANFQVRLAARRWLEIRKLGSTNETEKERYRLIDTIEHAIRELDLINQRAPSPERLNLLGSACKRLAWLSGSASYRLEALVNMERYYQQALDMHPTPKPYAFSNWAFAAVFARHLAPGKDDSWQEPMQAQCRELATVARELNALSPNFWDAVSEPDCELVHMLIGILPGRSVMTQDDVERTCARISELYREAGRRGASPRAFSSVLEHLDFLIDQFASIELHQASDAIRTIRIALS